MKGKVACLVLFFVAIWLVAPAGGLGGQAFAASPPMTKWIDPVPVPPVAVTKHNSTYSSWADYYEITMTAHTHKFNSSLRKAATVWTYGQGDTAVYLGPTVVATSNRPVVIKWINQLPTKLNKFPLKDSIDPTLPGSDVPTGAAIPHLHGGPTAARFDGTPDQWWTADGKTGMDFVTDTFIYLNNLPATLLWYHDHTMGATRLKPYLGLAAGYLVFDNNDDGNTIGGQKVPSGYGKYHLPLVLQDKEFNADGTLFYPTQGISATHPIWVPEFFGDTPVVNGKAYAYLDAQPRRYRLRFLNGSQARFYNFHFNMNGTDLPFWVIGSEGGLLPAPVEKTEQLIAPGERFDVIVDLTGVPLGSVIMLTNDAPAPYPMGDPANDAMPELLKIKVNTKVPNNDRDRTVPPAQLRLQPIPRLTPTWNLPPRDVVLKENADANDKPVEVLLNGYHFMDPVTDFVKLGTTETWQWINLTRDAHPMHTHLFMFQVLNRQKFDVNAYTSDWQAYLDSGRNPALKPNLDIYLIGDPIPPDPEETGFKDTVKAYPSLDPNDASYSYVTRVRARIEVPVTSLLDFDYKTGSFGKWVYHCHILEHEENDMMRPFVVVK
jgi:spore coat protein A, manganese oxidase